MRVYSVREVAVAVGLCRRSVYRAVQRGDIVVQRSPSGWFMGISDEALDYWISFGPGAEVLARALSRKSRASNAPSRPTSDTPGTGNQPTSPQGKPRPRKTKP